MAVAGTEPISLTQIKTMTKVIILGEEPKKECKEKIKAIHLLNEDLEKEKYIVDDGSLVQFEIIELVCRNYYNGDMDLLFAYDKGDRSAGALYLGHFNDGVV